MLLLTIPPGFAQRLYRENALPANLGSPHFFDFSPVEAPSSPSPVGAGLTYLGAICGREHVTFDRAVDQSPQTRFQRQRRQKPRIKSCGFARSRPPHLFYVHDSCDARNDRYSLPVLLPPADMVRFFEFHVPKRPWLTGSVTRVDSPVVDSFNICLNTPY